MKHNTTKRDTRAVSPIIGVILIVGITIVLAATMAPMFFNFGNNISKSAKAASSVKFEQGDSKNGEVTVTYLDRGNTEKLEVKYSVQTNPGSNSLSGPASPVTLNEPGDTMTVTEDGANTDETIEVKVIVVAYLESGEKAVVYTNTKEI